MDLRALKNATYRLIFGNAQRIYIFGMLSINIIKTVKFLAKIPKLFN